MLGRVAVVHDYLSQFGGAERVALALAETFEAPIYTSVYQPNLTLDEFQQRDVRVTPLQRLVPEGHFRWAAPILGKAFRTLDLSEFDTVIVSSSGFAHHVVHPNAYVYCHTPPRFIYDLDQYFSNRALIWGTRPFVPWLRRADQRAARRHEHYVANSMRTAGRISECYAKDVDVIHPVLRTDHLTGDVVALPSQPRALVVARLQPYKRIDLAIHGCARAGIPLTIAGTGIDEARLRAMAHGDVTFLGRVPDSALPELFATHSMVLAPGVEDFGLAPVEANYAGRPVVAQGAGGALETVDHGITGLLVKGTEEVNWADAIEEAASLQWDPAALRQTTERFQMPAFQRAVAKWVGSERPSEGSRPVVR